jgi:hypothetical protein
LFAAGARIAGASHWQMLSLDAGSGDDERL